MSPTDSYRILELSIGASQHEIRAAYHKMVRQWHPDKFHNDPDMKRIAEGKIREVIVAYKRLERTEGTQPDRDAEDMLRDAVEELRRSAEPREFAADDAFYESLKEAIHSGTHAFTGEVNNSHGDEASAHQQAHAESSATGRVACAYVGGDPRLEHLTPGFLGCPASVTWNSSGVTLHATGVGSVHYPALSLRSVRMARRSSLAFLSESTARINVADPGGVRGSGFQVKLRFPDRYTAEVFASQLEKIFSLESLLDERRFHPALLVLLLLVLTVIGLGIGLAVKNDLLAVESDAAPPPGPLVEKIEDRGRASDDDRFASVPEPDPAEASAVNQAGMVVEIERAGGSVIQNQGRIVGVRLAGARVNDSLLESISGLQDLEELNLYATTIKGEQFQSLSQLPNLTVLDLGSTRNAAVGVKSLIGLTRLQVLRLTNTDVSDAELQLLAQLPDLQELEVISTQVTEIGIEAFNVSRPDCDVVR